MGKHQGLSGGRGARGKHGHKLLLWFLWGRPGKEGEVDLDWVICMISVGSGLQGSLQLSGSGMLRAQEYCLLQCKSQRKEAVWSIGSGFVSLHMKDTLPVCCL